MLLLRSSFYVWFFSFIFFHLYGSLVIYAPTHTLSLFIDIDIDIDIFLCLSLSIFTFSKSFDATLKASLCVIFYLFLSFFFFFFFPLFSSFICDSRQTLEMLAIIILPFVVFLLLSFLVYFVFFLFVFLFFFNYVSECCYWSGSSLVSLRYGSKAKICFSTNACNGVGFSRSFISISSKGYVKTPRRTCDKRRPSWTEKW